MIYLNELYFSFSVFHKIVEMQYTCDSLKHGPTLDNVTFTFDFIQTQFTNTTSEELYKSTSLAL